MQVAPSNCVKPCSGVIVTSFSKSQPDKTLEDVFPIYEAYNSYKKVTLYPLWSSGKYMKSRLTFIYLFPEYEWRNNLRFVKIFFHTPTFDRITKERAAKFVDMLSAIGGTMGLLTGFSIISAVEIVFFSVKIIFNLISKT